MPSTNTPLASALTLSVVAAASALITASIFDRRHKQLLYQLSKVEETRAAERKGRIRAEQKLRTQLKNEAVHSNVKDSNVDDGGDEDASTRKHNLQLDCIGTVVSPYTKRMGTPRQGALVPSGRGYIELRIPVECVEGLELYSHAWVLFTFHANTDTGSVVKQQNGKSDGHFLNLTKTKIRPPRGNGIKVGMLATRSPHRPNNIGLSLVRVVKVDKKEKRLHINAFDLVNGTPVYGKFAAKASFVCSCMPLC